ncbi:MAG: hypothetical protein VZQ83_01810 [Eubacterium sp.]|nr:hypothetical protein [Eubacterium sp.]
MEQAYCEWSVKKRKTVMTTVLKIVSILIVVGLVLSTMLFTWFAILGVAAAGFLIWYWPRFDVMLEYVYCDGQLDFDQIFGGEKRKTALRIEIEDADVVAVKDSPRLDGYRHLPVKDFSSGDPDKKVYAIATKLSDGDAKTVILFEPSDKMLDMMYAKCPRTVEK